MAAALAWALRHAALALVNADTPVSVMATDMARPVGEVLAVVTQPRSFIRARFRLTVDRSSISLPAEPPASPGLRR
jgi:hypothetical protein